jgi:predicted MFS family arabinose efflux permease
VTQTLGGQGSVSTVFGVYFLCFALVLAPAGRYAARHNLRNMMVFGLALCAAGLLLLAAAGGFYQILLARAVSAAGQGILLIAVQSYLLRLEDGGNVAGGASVIVLGFNIGTISGTAIGALLVATLGEHAVFWIGALIAVFCMAYTFWMVRDDGGGRPLPASADDSEGGATGGIWRVLFNFELLKTILLVGIPTKAVFAGVLIFAMPIILQQQGFEHDLIGQMLIFYSIGILITTSFIRPIIGFLRATSVALLVGSIGAGAGLLLIGSQGWLLDAAVHAGWCEGDCKPVNALAIVAGVLVLGLFHGLIHAPVVSYITRIPGTERVGKSVVAANYRLLERVGHMIGPPVAAALLLAADGSLQLMHVIYLGGGIIAAGLAFFLVRQGARWRTQ